MALAFKKIPALSSMTPIFGFIFERINLIYKTIAPGHCITASAASAVFSPSHNHNKAQQGT